MCKNYLEFDLHFENEKLSLILAEFRSPKMCTKKLNNMPINYIFSFLLGTLG